MNALDYEIPSDANYFFFFNPFNLSTMSVIINKIIESIKQNNRLVTLIYYNPRLEKEIERTPNITLKNEIIWHNLGLYKSRCKIYELTDQF